MGEAYVIDTHALFWYLTAPDRLGAEARAAIDRRDTPGVEAIVSAITVAELYYVNEKAGRPLDFDRAIEELESGGLELADFEAEDVLLFRSLEDIPEMHDRIIAALALRRGASMVTKDERLARSAGVRAVW